MRYCKTHVCGPCNEREGFVTYNDEQRKSISMTCKGLTIEKMAWCEEEKYWVITFTNGGELCVRLMAECEIG